MYAKHLIKANYNEATDTEIDALLEEAKANLTTGKTVYNGKGIENPNTGRKGDMFVVIKVIMPTKLDREQKDLINKLSKTNLETSSEFSKIKKYMDKM